jgi:3-ketosteroid 9alpha-monooxygenase subunit A
VKVPFTWKVTGWFMIGWSAEFPAADVRPLLEWNIVDQEWRFLTGWPDASSDDPDKCVADPQPYVRARRRHQRIRRFVKPSADLRVHADRRRKFQHVLFDLVAEEAGRNLRHSSRRCPRACGETVPGHRLGRPRHLALPEYIERPALSKIDAKPYMALRKWATQFYDVPPSGDVTVSA